MHYPKSDEPSPARGERDNLLWNPEPQLSNTVNCDRSSYPRISIVTPSYNQGQFLEATIRSVLLQEYPNLEYIIIDGNSTDGSLDIIKKYEPYLHFWCSEPDAGQYHAINKGFAHSTGEILAWINSDDLQCPWALKTVASVMSTLPEVEWLSSLCPGFCDQHGICSGFGLLPGFSQAAFLDGRYLPSGVQPSIPIIGIPDSIQQESTFWRRSLWDKIGEQVSTQFDLAGDFDLWAQFYTCADLYGIAVPLGMFRSQPNQRSRRIEQYLAEAETSLSRMRSSGNWVFPRLRSLSYRFKLDQVPKLRALIKTKYGYWGKRIIKESINADNTNWTVDQYLFR